MTDHRDPLQAAFDDYRRAPRDVVPPRGMTVDGLREFDRACNSGEPIRSTGGMTYDEDGGPAGMEPTEQYDRELAGVYVIPARLVYKLGVQPESIPNAHIIDD